MATVKVTVEMDQLDLRNATNANPVEGQHVDNLQGLLLSTQIDAFNPGPIDGQAGDRTKAAVGTFQQRNGLVRDYIVGPRTWEALIGF